MNFLSYWLWPNPAGWHYSDPKVMGILAFCAALIILSFIVRYWRRRIKNPMTKTLSKSWSIALFWFGLSGAFLTVSRVETIQFLSMRAVFAFWVLLVVLYCILQIVLFRRRHYTVLERAQVIDERDKYLPRKK